MTKRSTQSKKLHEPISAKGKIPSSASCDKEANDYDNLMPGTFGAELAMKFVENIKSELKLKLSSRK